MATRSVEPECYLNTHFGSVEGTVLVATLSFAMGRTNSTAFEILRKPGNMAGGGCRLGAARHQHIDFWASGSAL